ncbi:hypothetical protein ACFL2Q_11625 [Thermodesulfobacteriota bacterium]
MEYRPVNGPVYCRYAGTPPIINSKLAELFGIESQSPVELEQGSNVKLRIILEGERKRLTCHATVDWVIEDESSGDFRIGMSNLSLTEPEFEVLVRNFSDRPTGSLQFGPSVRVQDHDTEPVAISGEFKEITRIKAVTLPVSLIESIDMKRRDMPFSEFVTKGLRHYLKNR